MKEDLSITRRKFIVGSALMGGSLLLPRGLRAGGAGDSSESLRAFIVSDAHFGWLGGQGHPAVDAEIQKKMVAHILKRFDDLDVFIDTGDAHHSSPETINQGIQEWSDYIPGQLEGTPFYYLTGNHDVVPVHHLDQEDRVARFSNLSARPYYSFDMKGIHFLAVPQLEFPTFINRETWEWIHLDLELNKDKTVVILAHNNLRGSTYADDNHMRGYRGLADSDSVRDLLRAYPNVVAWMHGHNHDYRVVHQENVVHVSNGRIGGFNKDHSEANLGGIYLEITSDGLQVRSYCAERNGFFDELGYQEVSFKQKRPTTFNPAEGWKVNYGFGGSRDGQRVAINRHHISKDTQLEVFAKLEEDPTFNDDPNFEQYDFRQHRDTFQWELLGAQVWGASQNKDSIEQGPKYFEKENKFWRWSNPGVELLPQSDSEAVTEVVIPDPQYGKYLYLRTTPDRVFKLEWVSESSAAGGQLQFEMRFYRQGGGEIARQRSEVFSLNAGVLKQEVLFDFRDIDLNNTIYQDLSIDNPVQLVAFARVNGLVEPLALKRYSVSIASDQKLDQPRLLLDGVESDFKRVGQSNIFRALVSDEKRARSVVETFSGSQRVTWSISEANIVQQIRNASIRSDGEVVALGEVRNTWVSDDYIQIAHPRGQVSEPQLIGLKGIGLFQYKDLKGGGVQIDIASLTEGPSLVQIRHSKPLKIKASMGKALVESEEAGVSWIRVTHTSTLLIR